MSKAAIEHIQDHFSIEVVAAQYVDLLKELIQMDEGNHDEVNGS